MRRREELFLQGANLELSAFSKFGRAWPCRRKMNDVGLGALKAQNDVAIYQAFNVAVYKHFNRLLGTCKDQSTGFADAPSTASTEGLNVDRVPHCMH